MPVLPLLPIFIAKSERTSTRWARFFQGGGAPTHSPLGNTFFEHTIPNFFTAGPRLGYAWDRLMIFGTGGYASADLKSSACSSVTGLCDQTRSNGQSRNNGWYAGGGFDYMVHKGPVVDVLLGACILSFATSVGRASRMSRLILPRRTPE